MRKNTLRKTAHQYLKMNRTGSIKEKKQREHVIHKLINDLFIIKNVPLDWQALTQHHFQQLKKLWHKQKLQPTTIMKHMTIIRCFLATQGYDTTYISNQRLGLKPRKKTIKKIHVDSSILQSAMSPIGRSLLGLQIHFGLTRSEAMRLNPSIHVREDKVRPTREITSNSEDRAIPIITAEQQLIIDELQEDKNLIELYGYDTVRVAWKNELRHLRLPTQKSYRYLYAQHRFKQLESQLTHYKLQLLIMDEMAIKSRTTLWGYLNE